MKILYLAPDAVPFPKGCSVRIERTLRALIALGHEPRLFTPDAGGSRFDFLPHDAAKLPQGNFLARMLAFRKAAADWLGGRQADMVQFRGIWEGPPAIAWARRWGARAVFEPHGFPSIELPYHYPELTGGSRVLEKLVGEEQSVLGGADLVLTHSETGRRFLLMRGVPSRRIAVVPNAADTELFSPAAAPAPGPPWRIVYAGTLAPWQGLSVLLEALRLLRGRGAFELHALGPRKGPWRQELRRRARRLRVHSLLRLSDAVTQAELAKLLQGAHLCAAPMPADPRNSTQGACPLKLLEYMAAGRPILATAIAPVRELLSHGQDAYLAEPGSPAALAEGIAWLIGHPEEREALGRRARAAALARFSPLQFQSRLGAALEPRERRLEAIA